MLRLSTGSRTRARVPGNLLLHPGVREELHASNFADPVTQEPLRLPSTVRVLIVG